MNEQKPWFPRVWFLQSCITFHDFLNSKPFIIMVIYGILPSKFHQAIQNRYGNMIYSMYSILHEFYHWIKSKSVTWISLYKSIGLLIFCDRPTIRPNIRSSLRSVDETHLYRIYSIFGNTIFQHRYISWVSICKIFDRKYSCNFYSSMKSLISYIYDIISYFRVQKSAKQPRGNYQINYDDSRQNEVRKASLLIWISVFFILCQSVKVIPDFYEALYCTHKKVSFTISQSLYAFKWRTIYYISPWNFLFLLQYYAL